MSDNSQFMRTDKAIMQALISLLKQKPFEKITIQDILEETPVSRATFYAHFHDKFEIAEKMQDYFFSATESTKDELQSAPASQAQAIIHRSFSQHKELMDALLKVHTEKVNLRKAIVDQTEQNYLKRSKSSSRETEARIYAQALTELQLSFLYDDKNDFSKDYTNELFISVALELLDLTDDKETKEFLKKKVAEKAV